MLVLGVLLVGSSDLNSLSFYVNYNRETKGLTFWSGSEVSQVSISGFVQGILEYQGGYLRETVLQGSVMGHLMTRVPGCLRIVLSGFFLDKGEDFSGAASTRKALMTYSFRVPCAKDPT